MIDKVNVSVFCDDHHDNAPVIIYIPGIKNKSYGNFDPQKAMYTATTNFCYTADQAHELAGLAYQNMLDSKDAVIDAITHVIQKKRDRRSWLKWLARMKCS